MFNPNYLALGQLNEMQARRRLTDDWDQVHRLRPYLPGGIGRQIRAFGAWLVRQMAALRAVGAYWRLSAPASY